MAEGKNKLFTQTIRVESIKEIDTKKEKVESKEYRLTGHDSEKLSRVTVTSPNPFNGVGPGELIDITITTSQMSLEEFDPSEAEESESNASQDQEDMEADLKKK